jgi:hypothetical protein
MHFNGGPKFGTGCIFLQWVKLQGNHNHSDDKGYDFYVDEECQKEIQIAVRKAKLRCEKELTEVRALIQKANDSLETTE